MKSKKWFAALGAAVLITAGGLAVSHANQQTDSPKPPFAQRSEEAKKIFKEDHARLLEFLNIDRETFRNEMKAGKTLAEIAKERGISEQKLKNFMVSNMTKRINEGVADGKISADKAEKMKSHLEQRVTDMINGKKPDHREQRPHHGMFAGKEVLSLLKMDAQEFRSEMQAGKTLAQIAKERGVEQQELKDVMLKAFNDRIDNGLKDGRISSERAEHMRANAEGRIDDMINGKTHPRAPQK